MFFIMNEYRKNTLEILQIAQIDKKCAFLSNSVAPAMEVIARSEQSERGLKRTVRCGYRRRRQHKKSPLLAKWAFFNLYKKVFSLLKYYVQ